jgi:predicted DCC family thiol-disulfide oxidoreductase YuxK
MSAGTGRAAPGKLAVLYDGSCEMCVASIARINRYDNSGALEPLDLNDQAVRAEYPELKNEDLVRELHAVDERGNVFRGARAINQILRRQHGVKKLLAYLWYLPGYAWLADRQYKKIADSRYERDASGRLKSPAAPR